MGKLRDDAHATHRPGVLRSIRHVWHVLPATAGVAYRPAGTAPGDFSASRWHTQFANPWIYDAISRLRNFGDWDEEVYFERMASRSMAPLLLSTRTPRATHQRSRNPPATSRGWGRDGSRHWSSGVGGVGRNALMPVACHFLRPRSLWSTCTGGCTV